MAQNLLLLICLLVFLFSGWKLYESLRNYQEGDQTYEKIREQAEAVHEPINIEETQTDEAEAEEKTELPLYQAMREINPDYTGWLKIPDTKIDYPVVLGGDNSYYLEHSFEGEESILGCLFLDYRMEKGLDAGHAIIYGHNMKNGSMFAGLKKYREKEFYETHKTFTIETAYETKECQVFAAYVTSPASDVYAGDFDTEEELLAYEEAAFQASMYPREEREGEHAHILTLSTCVNQNRDRLVIQAWY